MPTPPPRKRYQIHLSTAIVMMFVAGALMWANFARFDTHYSDPHCKIYGWPCKFMQVYDNGFVLIYAFNHSMQPYGMLWTSTDCVVWIGSLYLSWFLPEWLIRRRAARKGA